MVTRCVPMVNRGAMITKGVAPRVVAMGVAMVGGNPPQPPIFQPPFDFCYLERGFGVDFKGGTKGKSSKNLLCKNNIQIIFKTNFCKLKFLFPCTIQIILRI